MVDPLIDELERFEQSLGYKQLEKECESLQISDNIMIDLGKNNDLSLKLAISIVKNFS